MVHRDALFSSKGLLHITAETFSSSSHVLLKGTLTASEDNVCLSLELR